MDKVLGPRLKRYMEKKGISQNQLAQRMEMSPVSLGRILKGEAKFPAELYLAICNELGISVEDLVD